MFDNLLQSIFGGGDDNAADRKNSIYRANDPKRVTQTWPFNVYGNRTGDNGPVPDDYLITVTSIKNRCSIVGIMQDDIKMRVESQWDLVLPAGIASLANQITQAITSQTPLGTRALIPQIATRRMWVGTSPIQMELAFRFEAVSDARSEVVMACQKLQALACPSVAQDVFDTSKMTGWGAKLVSTVNKAINSIGLTPPGPSPFPDWKGTSDEINNLKHGGLLDPTLLSSFKNGDFIIVEIGRLVTFWNVIVRSVDVTYQPRMTSEGDSVSATAYVNFETYEMPTIEDLNSAYNDAKLSAPIYAPASLQEQALSRLA